MEVEDNERWRLFCIQYAKSVAFKFAENWNQFRVNCAESVGTDELIKQFTSTFSDELIRRLTNTNQMPNCLRFHSLSSSAPLCSKAEESDLNEQPCTSLQSSSKRPASIADMSFLVRSCKEFTTLRKNPEPFSQNRQSSTRSSSTRLSWLRSRFSSKRTVEVIKEGHLRFMSGLELETKEWRKCRVCLVKTAGGSLLEFYSPPKSNRAKTGIFCFLIMEVREATRLEFEDSSETIFVIRAFNGVEYAVEAKSEEDCQQWISAVKESIPGIEWDSTSRLVRQPSAPPIGADFPGKRSFMMSRSLNNVPAMVTSLLAEPASSVVKQPIPRGLEIYPWFHARLSRAACERLLLHNGADGHGLFLVRQSETRPGDFVLSFNCAGKANHVRINVAPSGECRVHQLRFGSVVELLEHFRITPIPLENLSNPPMLLREYIICWRRRSLLLSDEDVDVRDFLTYAGSVALDINDLESLVIKEQTARRQRNSLQPFTVNRYNFV